MAKEEPILACMKTYENWASPISKQMLKCEGLRTENSSFPGLVLDGLNYKNCLLVLHACFSSLHREVLRFEDSKRASVRKVVCLLTICRPRVTKKIDAERSKRKSMRIHRDY